MGDVTVRLKALDGTWETCGADRARGVWPENVSGIRADAWGSKTVGFDLRRDPKAIWPDIAAFTRVQIDIDGVLRWSGRVAQTPVRDDLDSVISVQCEGMQAHLDDDLYEQVYVHTRLSDWTDYRSLLDATVGGGSSAGYAAGSVSSDRGLTLMMPKGDAVAAAAGVAVVLDFGPGSTAKRVVLDWTCSNNDANGQVALHGADSIGALGAGGEYPISFATNSGASGTSRGTFTTARRYLTLMLRDNVGGFTPAADVWVKFSSVQVFSDANYEAGDVSVFTTDLPISDALNRATILLSSDRTLIEAGTFHLPEFAPAEPRTPRQVWEAADAFEDRLKKIDLLDRPVYKAKPTTPRVEVGAWSAMSFEDASSNDGSEVYSRVIVKGTQPDGSPLRVERTQGGQPGVPFDVSSSPAPTNGTFEAGVTGWTATGSTRTQDTSVFDTGAASLRWDNTGASDNLGGGDLLTGTFTGTFFKGVHYALTLRARASTGSLKQFEYRWGALGTDEAHPDSPSFTTSFKTVTIYWTPQQTHTSGVTLQLDSLTTSAFFYIDEVVVSTPRPTIVERSGFQRTKVLDVSFTLTTAAAQQLGDLWLRAHARTPFKGTVKLTGPGAVRDILTGTPLPVDALLDMTGELIRFTDRIDPDTGAVGRDARIAEVSVDPDTDEATVTLDNSRAGFDALLARLDVVLGQNQSR